MVSSLRGFRFDPKSNIEIRLYYGWHFDAVDGVKVGTVWMRHLKFETRSLPSQKCF